MKFSDLEFVAALEAFDESAGVEPPMNFAGLGFTVALDVLTKPVLANPNSQRFVLGYAAHVHCPSCESKGGKMPGCVICAYWRTECLLPFGALVLCEPQARMKTIAMMLEVSETSLSNCISGRREPSAELTKRAAILFQPMLVLENNRLQVARDTLIANAWWPWTDARSDFKAWHWFTALSGRDGIPALRRAFRSRAFMDVLDGMMTPGSSYRQRRGESSRLSHLIAMAGKS